MNRFELVPDCAANLARMNRIELVPERRADGSVALRAVVRRRPDWLRRLIRRLRLAPV
jgi:hypothetical protein